jgi:glutamyl-tRNA synthetase
LIDGPVDDPAARERWLDANGQELLLEVRRALEALEDFDQGAVEGALGEIIQSRSLKPREVYQPLRVAIAGSTVSPGIFESVALLGRDETLGRIDEALASG